MSEEFRLRSIAVAAYGPATLFGLAEGAMLPVIALSALDRGASASVAALIAALLGIGSIVTNIPSGILTTRVGERKSMMVAAIATACGLVLCVINLGHAATSLLVFGFGILLIGAASSVYSLARQSYLTEMVPPHTRARALSSCPTPGPASGRSSSLQSPPSQGWAQGSSSAGSSDSQPRQRWGHGFRVPARVPAGAGGSAAPASGVVPIVAQLTDLSAVRMTSVTASGWEIMMTCEPWLPAPAFAR